MEIEQEQQNNSKDFLSTKKMLLSTIIIIAEAIFAYVIGYLVIDLGIEGELAVILAIPLLLFDATISIVGIIVGFLYLKKNKFNIIPVVLIIFSIITLPIFGMKFKTSIVEPIVRTDINNRQIKNSLKYQNDQRIMLEKITKEFENNKTVKFDETYHASYGEDISIIILQNGDVISQYEFSVNQDKAFISWAKSNIVGKKITLTIPNGFLAFACGNDSNNIVSEIRKNYGFSWNAGGWCDILRVNIYFNNEPISEKFK